MSARRAPFALAAAGLAAAALAIGAPSALASAASGGLAISPQPGTPDASPQSQISILGVAPDRISSVTATGSVTGAHPGRLRAYSGEAGASFVPADPFSQGEQVDVVIRIKGRKPISYSFKIADLGPIPPPLNLPQRQPDKLQSFVSRPDLAAPQISVRRPAPELPGDIFLTPLPSPAVHPGSNNTITIHPVGPGGPMIIDGRGRLVWFRQLEPPDVAANLRLQRFDGHRVLTWWQGTVTPTAFGQGEGVIADHRYRTIATVKAGNGYGMDLHEFDLTPSGDALFTVYSPIQVHLPGTPAGTLSPLMDAIVQEVDIKTGLVVWEWHAYGHIPLRDSYASPANSASYDAFHINSIQPLAAGQLLVSARDTSAVYDVDQSSGDIRWTLGGKASTFDLGRRTRFWFQHDARMLPNGDISMFDDGAGPPKKQPFSRGLVLKLHPRHHRATLVDEYHRSTFTSAQSEGSVQMLPGGNVFVGFGSERYFSEFTKAGRLLFDGALPKDDGTYRTYRFCWSGRPRGLPAVAAKRASPSTVSVYASWNGATQVARWQVLAGDSSGSLSPVATAGKGGFETRIDVNSSAGMFAVRALGADGKVLATSRPVAAS